MQENEKVMLTITININAINKFKLNSIKHVELFLIENKLIPKVISCERTEQSKNIHYHVLAECPKEMVYDIYKELWLNHIFTEVTRNEYAYYQYIIKDGNYKTYDYVPQLPDTQTSEYQRLLDDIFVHNKSMDEIRITYPKLFVRYYNTIQSMFRNWNMR